MKLLLWNVNGLRAISQKNVEPNVSFSTFLEKYDIVVLNETKISESQIKSRVDIIPETFHAYHSHSQTKQGYSGVSILSTTEPIRRIKPTFKDEEGRLVILEFKSFILIGVYTPNAGTFDKVIDKPKRHSYRTKTWDLKFRSMCIDLEKTKPLIVLGDLNVAYTEMDIYDPNKFHNHAGFTLEERNNFGYLLETTSLIDVWRREHPTRVEYSFFNYRSNARARNAGWRIDYALVSKSLYNKISSCNILSRVMGSDHLPLALYFHNRYNLV